jgi:AmmeMemoRadiSam system protein B
MLRQAIVAGSFYPGRKALLETSLQQLVPQTQPGPARGVMLPHAGYIYSGAIAGATLARVSLPERIVLLGPNHHGAGAAFAVSSAQAWQTPLGNIELAGELASRLVAASDLATFDETAHRREHSLEVLVPFIQWLNPAAQIVPVCIRSHRLAELLDFGSALAACLADEEQSALIIASSDMSHYLPGELARELDFLAIERALELDPEGLFRVVLERRISMCGVAPCVAMLQACLGLGAARAELVRYGNSGDQTGDQSEVVGYAGMVVV